MGTGKTLAPAGVVNDGNGGANYAVTFASDTTGVITARAVTVTAATDTKTYDSTTSSAAVPTITAGTLAGTDTGSFTQTFDTKNVGAAKTLTPAGSITDGNGGANYAITFATNTTGVITARAITVTATTDSKTYDATTTSAAIPTITTGTLAGTDTGSFTQTFDNANVGTGKTLTPAGSISDGNLGANYAITFVNDTTGVISQWAVTVTADSGEAKIYGTPDPTFTYTVTSGSLQPGDSFSGALARTAGENVGIYAINQGTLTAGPNYTITFVPANFTIVARAITVTASTDTKTYDATTASAGAPTVTTGTLAGTDTGAFTQTFGNKNVERARRSTPAGVVNDGNGGANYAITFANNTTGVITARAVTVTATTDTKTYNSSTSSSAVPTVTTGTLVGTDTGSFTQTFDTKNVGTAKTLTPAGSITDGNGGANYAITFATNTTGAITARAITVTASTDTKTYDGTTTSAAIPTITTGTLAGSDTGSFTQTFDNANVGTGKTLIAAGSVNDGTSAPTTPSPSSTPPPVSSANGP